MLHRWLDAWQELVATLARNPLRTGLTAAGVAWGMFMLVLMTGFGAGLEHGVRSSLGRRVSNAVYFWGRTTSLPFRGNRPGRPVRYNNQDMAAILEQVDGIAVLAPRNQLGGWRAENAVHRGLRSVTASVYGDVPENRFVAPMGMTDGRYLNQRDLDGRRRVASVGIQVAEELMPEGGSLVGERIWVGDSHFTVVGVFTALTPGEDADRMERSVHVPLSTFQQVFHQGDRVRWFAMVADPDESASEVEAAVRKVLQKRHSVHPDDLPAIGSRNAEAEFRRMQDTFAGIRAFVLFVGAMTLLAGAFGVTNVMLVSVGERTRELGLRRALGATRVQVRAMILRESLLLTLVAGQTGLLVGVGLLELTRITGVAADTPLGSPHVDATIVAIAAVFMTVAGLVAGYLPAARAAAIHPVQALRG